MLAFEDAWRSFTDKIEELPNLETYSKVLYKCRTTLWEVMTKVRLSIPVCTITGLCVYAYVSMYVCMYVCIYVLCIYECCMYV